MAGVKEDVASGRGLGPLVEFASRVLAPAGVVTAVLYYFGYTRELALFAYFGVDLGSLGFSTTDYLVRSAGTLLQPLAMLLLAAVAAITGHYVILFVLRKANRRSRRLVWVALGAIALILLMLGVMGLLYRRAPFFSPLAAPVALGTGAALLNYAVDTALAIEAVHPQLAEALAATTVLRHAVAAAFVLLALFWGTANVARGHGINTAKAFEVSLAAQPQAVVYSRDRLQITGPGVKLVPLDAEGSAFAYRYSGLRTLVHTDGHWFLLPVGWTHENGSTVILLSDNASDIRVELAP